MATGLLVVISRQDEETGEVKSVGTQFMTLVTPEAARKELGKIITQLEQKGFIIDGVILDNIII